jgi:hypothetical protein
MTSAVQSDFVDVQLSAAGLAMVGVDGALQIANAHLSYKFTPGKSTRVLTSEWAKLLSKETIQGQNVLELAPVVVVSVPQGASAADELAAVKTEEAALSAQIADQSKPAARGSK